MRPILPLFILFIAVISCTQYQYLTVSGVDIVRSDNSGFVSENDTLKIHFAFSDYKEKVAIRDTQQTRPY